MKSTPNLHPTGLLLEDGDCILPKDCRCLAEGQFRDVGDHWNDTGRCQTCTCKDHGIIECGPYMCNECPAGQVPVSQVGQCCPVCVPDWVMEKEDTITKTEGQGPIILECILHDDVLVTPDDVR